MQTRKEQNEHIDNMKHDKANYNRLRTLIQRHQKPFNEDSTLKAKLGFVNSIRTVGMTITTCRKQDHKCNKTNYYRIKTI